jgi:AmmeMemoRadiSam system protein B
MLSRNPAVAGAFYPADSKEINSYLQSVFTPSHDKIHPKSIIVPHAGYVYSGHIAAKAYSLIDSFDTYIILGPNHTGLGEEISVFDGIYRMPYGDVEPDSEMIDAIISNCEYAKRDYLAHIQEHSIEVQLPFINYVTDKPYKIVPIVIGTHSRAKLKKLAGVLSSIIDQTSKDVLIVVSSDMNHYESQEITLQKDQMVLDKILTLDEESMFDAVESNGVSMCGVACAYAAILASKNLGASNAKLIEHATSGDVNFDYSQVVGYASIVIV